MKELCENIKKMKKPHVEGVVNDRLREFQEMGKASDDSIFKELCFCILTANFSAERSIKIQREIGDGMLTLSEEELSTKLRELGHRFPNVRAQYIVEAREYKDCMREIMESFDDDKRLREWLAKNVKGLGYKEASHFLRNIGYTNLAIIDFHIIDLLTRCGIIDKPKTLTKRRYLEIENRLREIARETDLNLAELDLYLWCMETERILK